jgi:hypothetical protein
MPTASIRKLPDTPARAHWPRTWWVAVAALVVALLAAVGLTVSGVRAAGHRPAGPVGMMTGSGSGTIGGGYGSMMGVKGGAAGWLPGDGKPVRSLSAAQARAQEFADRLDLRVGEVMQFSNGFYAELLTAAGAGGTEVLIEPGYGAVHLEYGPAMMWNTVYGMHASGAQVAVTVTAADAVRLANDWLRTQRPGSTAGVAETYPGYYTLHVLVGGDVGGMLSVNATTGAVWYHGWHGRFVTMSES